MKVYKITYSIWEEGRVQHVSWFASTQKYWVNYEPEVWAEPVLPGSLLFSYSSEQHALYVLGKKREKNPWHQNPFQGAAVWLAETDGRVFQVNNHLLHPNSELTQKYWQRFPVAPDVLVPYGHPALAKTRATELLMHYSICSERLRLLELLPCKCNTCIREIE